MILMNVTTVADYLTIINFVISTFILVSASVSKRIRKWIKSILIECLDDYLAKVNESKDTGGNI